MSSWRAAGGTLISIARCREDLDLTAPLVLSAMVPSSSSGKFFELGCTTFWSFFLHLE
jgi:hypothetical protein